MEAGKEGSNEQLKKNHAIIGLIGGKCGAAGNPKCLLREVL